MCDQIKEYMEGNVVKFTLKLLDMGQCHDFQKKVLHKLTRIPRGKVVSYGRLAGKAGAPGAARATGTALARNPFPIILPCHRVVKSTGHPGNFGGGQELKEALLRIEGVQVNTGGKIEQRYFW
jgi:methylated-DNA-[protein]-cysteine S-methyltransferase